MFRLVRMAAALSMMVFPGVSLGTNQGKGITCFELSRLAERVMDVRQMGKPLCEILDERKYYFTGEDMELMEKLLLTAWKVPLSKYDGNKEFASREFSDMVMRVCVRKQQ